MDVEEGHCRGRLGAAENAMRRSLFPEIGKRATERFKNGKRVKETGGEHIKNNVQQVVSVRTLEAFARKNTWQVADVRFLVSAFHII